MGGVVIVVTLLGLAAVAWLAGWVYKQPEPVFGGRKVKVHVPTPPEQSDWMQLSAADKEKWLGMGEYLYRLTFPEDTPEIEKDPPLWIWPGWSPGWRPYDQEVDL